MSKISISNYRRKWFRMFITRYKFFLKVEWLDTNFPLTSLSRRRHTPFNQNHQSAPIEYNFQVPFNEIPCLNLGQGFVMFKIFVKSLKSKPDCGLLVIFTGLFLSTLTKNLQNKIFHQSIILNMNASNSKCSSIWWRLCLKNVRWAKDFW